MGKAKDHSMYSPFGVRFVETMYNHRLGYCRNYIPSTEWAFLPRTPLNSRRDFLYDMEDPGLYYTNVRKRHHLPVENLLPISESKSKHFDFQRCILHLVF